MKYLVPIKLSTKFRNKFNIANFQIRPITDFDREKLFGITKVELDNNGNIESYIKNEERNLINFGLLEKLKIFSVTSIIEFNKDGLIEDIIKDISTLLLAFRLFKQGDIFAPIIFNDKTPAIYFTQYPNFCKESTKYEISKRDIEKINNIFNLLKKIKPNSHISFALERYNFAINKNTNEKNSYVEFVSILESLFLEANQELSFRFSLILSYILSNKLKEKISFKKIKNFYSVRSQLVHGKSKNKDCYNKEKLNLINNLVRKLIVWYLQNNSPQYEQIEKMIFNKLKIL